MTPYTRPPSAFSVDQAAEQLAVSSRRSAGGPSGANCMFTVAAASSVSPRMALSRASRNVAGSGHKQSINDQTIKYCIRFELLLYVYILIPF
jgi:hypothetical protein